MGDLSRLGAAAPATTFAKRSHGMAQHDSGPQVDMARLRAYRLARLQAAIRDSSMDAALLLKPANIRYACGSSNMLVWTQHNDARYALVPAEGKVVLFEFSGCAHLNAGLEAIGEIRPARSWQHLSAGPAIAGTAQSFAREIADLVIRAWGGRRLLVDRIDPAAFHALRSAGLLLGDAGRVVERARAIKSADELHCMNTAVAAAEAGVAAMREALRPGMTENELWSLLHRRVIELGGESVETRLLASGPRTNPWFQECSERAIEAGDLVVFDTDIVGSYGYGADFSRAFHCGPARPSAAQRELYSLALEQLDWNLSQLAAGLDFRSFVDRAWQAPARFRERRYGVVAHGVGLSEEWPELWWLEDAADGYDEGCFLPGMVICVESYIAELGGREGVKLEQQVLITETGTELLSTFPMEEELLSP